MWLSGILLPDSLFYFIYKKIAYSKLFKDYYRQFLCFKKNNL